MELIIHTGHGKTGSSSIQATLDNNKKLLQENKIFYVGLNFEFSPVKKYDWQKPYGWPILNELSQNDLNEQLFNLINNSMEMLQKHGYTKVIWSNESLFIHVGKLDFVISKLQKSFNITTISYIRRHDKWLKSAYFQWGVKHKTYLGSVKGFIEWAKMGVHFSSAMKAWKRINGNNCYFVNFDACGDVSDSFIKLLGFHNNELSTFRVNDTPNNVELAMYALYNSLFTEEKMPNDLGPLLFDYKVNNLQEADIQLDKIFPTVEQLSDVFSACQDDLNTVNEIFESQGQPVFSFEENIINSKVPDITSDKMIAVLIHIVNEQNKKIDMLNQSVEKLKVELAK